MPLALQRCLIGDVAKKGKEKNLSTYISMVGEEQLPSETRQYNFLRADGSKDGRQSRNISKKQLSHLMHYATELAVSHLRTRLSLRRVSTSKTSAFLMRDVGESNACLGESSGLPHVHRLFGMGFSLSE